MLAVLLPFGQEFIWGDLGIVALLILLEGVLSIDNALVLGLLAKRLPKHQQSRALTYGLIGAFAFRFLAIGAATWLLKWPVVKLIGGGYLIYISVKHLWFESGSEKDAEVTLSNEGTPMLVDEETGKPLTAEQESAELEQRSPTPMTEELVDGDGSTGQAKFWPTVAVIELTDVAFAVDSILAAIALVGPPPKEHAADAIHPKLWVIITGGMIGVILMRFAAILFIKMLERLSAV